MRKIKHIDISEAGYVPPIGPSKVNYGLPVENSGLVYKVMPLSFNLQLKGNDYLPSTSKCDFKIGDYVYGKCKYDKKYHTGHITKISINDENKVVFIYILDKKLKTNIALIPSTVNFETSALDEAELYWSSLESMNNTIKDYKKSVKKHDREYEPRHLYIEKILGKITYNKFTDFSPIPLSTLHLTIDDFILLNPYINKRMLLSDDASNFMTKFITEMNKVYSRYTFTMGYDINIHTNIVLKNLDEVIDFFKNIERIYKKITKNSEINWKYLVLKFRNYFK